MPSLKSPSPTRLSPWLAWFAPLTSLVMYWSVLQHDLFGASVAMIANNPQVNGTAPWSALWLSPSPAEGLYRPLLTLFWRLEWLTFGPSPSSFHSVNLLLFLGIVILFMMLVSALTPHPWARLAAALTLGVHPMASQAVHNVADQGILLSVAACLAACLMLVRTRRQRTRPRRAALAIALCAAVAMGTHELGWILPIWLAMLMAAVPQAAPAPVPTPAAATKPTHHRRSRAAAVASATPAAAAPAPVPARVNRPAGWLALIGPAVALLLVLTFARIWAVERFFADPLAREQGFAALSGPEWLKPFAVMGAALGRLLWPMHPTVIYDPLETAASYPASWMGLAAMLLGLAAAAWAMRRGHWAGAALLMALTPVALLGQIVPLTPFMSEGPLLFALPGACLALGALFERLMAPRWMMPPLAWRDRVLALVLAALLGAMAWTTMRRGSDWSRSVTLWSAEIGRHPDSAVPYIELLDDYARQNKPDQALQAAAEARRRTRRPEQLDRIAELEGAVYATGNEVEKLRTLINAQLKDGAAHQPGHFNRLAGLAHMLGMAAEAEVLHQTELKRDPNDFVANFELAELARLRKRFPEAIALSKLAVSQAPPVRRAEAMTRYGMVLGEAGKITQAITQLKEVLEIDASAYEPYIYLARLYWGQKDYEKAERAIVAGWTYSRPQSVIDFVKLYTFILEDQKQFARIRDMHQAWADNYPGDVEVQLFLARYQLDLGRYEAARTIYERLLDVPGPARAEVYTGMGRIAFFGDKNVPIAIRAWERALELEPTHAEARKLLNRARAMKPEAPTTRPAPTATLRSMATPAQPTLTATPLPAATVAPANPATFAVPAEPGALFDDGLNLAPTSSTQPLF